jgi:hypothetical protein
MVQFAGVAKQLSLQEDGSRFQKCRLTPKASLFLLSSLEHPQIIGQTWKLSTLR